VQGLGEPPRGRGERRHHQLAADALPRVANLFRSRQPADTRGDQLAGGSTELAGRREHPQLDGAAELAPPEQIPEQEDRPARLQCLIGHRVASSVINRGR
jgi:hypothetical protein